MNIKVIMRILSRLGKTDGAEIAEAALVLPLVFTLLLGIIWFGRAFNIYSTIAQAAQQGAITAARSTCATTCLNAPASDAAVTAAVSGVLQASSLDPTQIPVNSSPPAPPICANLPPALPQGCTTTGNITVCRNAQLNPTAGQTQVCGAVVGFQYPFQFYLPFTSLNLQLITMTAQAQSRMEN